MRPGRLTFVAHCKSCHGYVHGRDPRAPTLAAMRAYPAEVTLASLESGSMQGQGAALTPDERALLARELGTPAGQQPLVRCAPGGPAA